MRREICLTTVSMTDRGKNLGNSKSFALLRSIYASPSASQIRQPAPRSTTSENGVATLASYHCHHLPMSYECAAKVLRIDFEQGGPRRGVSWLFILGVPLCRGLRDESTRSLTSRVQSRSSEYVWGLTENRIRWRGLHYLWRRRFVN
jgi:hypothetical protein